MELIDTHTHLFDVAFNDDREETVQRAVDAGVSRMLLPAIDSQSHQALFALANAHPETCLPMMGLHPTSVNESPDFHDELKRVEQILKNPPVEKFYAVGEIGLDLYWSKDHLDDQIEAFRFQIELALSYDLPIVVHTRDAWPEMHAVLETYRGRGLRGVMHAFSGNVDDYRRVKTYGDFVFGIGGVLTYPRSFLSALLRSLSPDDLVLETDAPYLTPVPFRGKRNESAFLVAICEKTAEILGLPASEIAQKTTRNAQRMFRLDARV